MQDAVEEAMVSNHTDDSVLNWLMKITVSSISSKRPLFQSPYEEPVLYTLFEGWVQQAIKLSLELDKAKEQALEQAMRPTGGAG